MRLHFIRHGETNWNAIRRVQGQMESQLTDLGKHQAEQLAEHLRTYPISQVYCSSSVRTRETASILFASLLHSSQPSISYQDNLREIHLGPWEGNLYDDLAQQDPEQFHNFWNEPHQFALAGAESFWQLQQRGVDAVREIVQQPNADDVAIVSHGALIKSILCHFEDRPLSLLWEPPKMHNCAHSIMEFESDGQGRIIQYAGLDYQSEPGNKAMNAASDAT